MEKRIVRVRFEKTGPIQYISHLDLGRTLSRALRRMNAPLWFSEGYHPHPKLTFALPLSVGTQSLCEICDVAVVADAPAGCLNGLGDQLPQGLRVTALEEGSLRKLADIAFAQYVLTFPTAQVGAQALEERLCQPLPVEKHGKKGPVTLDVAQQLSQLSVSSTPEGLSLSVVLPAGGERGILNPEYLLKALETQESFAHLSRDCRIVRQRLLDAAGQTF